MSFIRRSEPLCLVQEFFLKLKTAKQERQRQEKNQYQTRSKISVFVPFQRRQQTQEKKGKVHLYTFNVKNLHMASCCTNASTNVQNEGGIAVLSFGKPNLKKVKYQMQHRPTAIGAAYNGIIPSIQRPSVAIALPTIRQGTHNSLPATRGRRFGRQEVCDEPGRQRRRRQGVCDSIDGTRVDRTFVRVLNKRF